jgi:methyl-accepting chemotaxis protein
MEQLTGICSTMSGATERLSSNTGLAASIAQEAMGSMQAAKSATDELSKSFDEVVEQVNSANTATSNAVAASEETGRKIDALNQAVAEIGGITTLIKDIARMTNLLAVNAGVEAARAGALGLGFDVIAREVKSLSAQTSDATNRISNLINQVQESTNEAVASVAGVSSIIKKVNQVSVKMFDAIRQQVQSSRRIAANVAETTSAVAQVTARIEEVAAEASGVGKQATEVDVVCGDVADKVHGLQESLVRTLRSSADTNRRSARRYQIRCPGKIEIQGKTQPVDIIDISIGGAKVEGTFSGKSSRCTLRLQDWPLSLPGQIVSSTHEEAHIQFSLNADIVSLLNEQLEKRFEKLTSFGAAA